MARSVLTPCRAAALCLGLVVLSCKHEQPKPAPTPAATDSATELAQAARFESELEHARALWQAPPSLHKCAELLPEKADTERCRAASSALTAMQQLDARAAPETVLPKLSDLALALVRLVERARYLSLEQLGRSEVEGDAGAPRHAASAARPSASLAPSAASAPADLSHGLQNLLRDRPRLKITESPLSHFVQDAARLERDALRNLAAYLEYAPLPVRRAAFDVAAQLQAVHPEWPALNHVLREAWVLETDGALKRRLSELTSRAWPRGKRPDPP